MEYTPLGYRVTGLQSKSFISSLKSKFVPTDEQFSRNISHRACVVLRNKVLATMCLYRILFLMVKCDKKLTKRDAHHRIPTVVNSAPLFNNIRDLFNQLFERTLYSDCMQHNFVLHENKQTNITLVIKLVRIPFQDDAVCWYTYHMILLHF